MRCMGRMAVLAAALGGVAGLAAPVAAQEAAQAAPGQDPRDAEIAELRRQLARLAARIDALERARSATPDAAPAPVPAPAAQVAAAAPAPAPTPATVAPPATRLSGRMYYNLTQVDERLDGVKTNRSGIGFDVRRFYLGVDHRIDATWALNLTTDFQYSSAIGSTQVFVKKAYVEGRFGPALTLRAGSADMPWVPFAEGWNGYRWIEPSLVDRLRFGTSADWGLHASGRWEAAGLDYAAALVGGGGFRNPTRSKRLDVETRLAYAPSAHTVLALGGYSGTLGLDAQQRPALHTATRWTALLAYADGPNRLGAEYFLARNWNDVVLPRRDEASGYSLWGSVGIGAHGMALFARYDRADLSRLQDPALRQTYYNLGLEWPLAPGIRLATVLKHLDQRGTHGDLDQQGRELGLWGEFRF